MNWQPIDTAPRYGMALFWVVPKTADEAYCDTSGNPITYTDPSGWVFMGRYRTWSAMSKATHWMPLPTRPAVTVNTKESL